MKSLKPIELAQKDQRLGFARMFLEMAATNLLEFIHTPNNSPHPVAHVVNLPLVVPCAVPPPGVPVPTPPEAVTVVPPE